MPYLASPTSCTAEPVAAEISARSVQEPEREASTQMGFGPFGDCDRLKLPATFVAAPTTQEAYAPTGLNAELGVHQTYEDAEGLASAHLNKAVVTLPEGMTVNPSAGSGSVGCTVEEFEHEVLETEAGKGCPNESKLGSVKIQAPAIKEEAFGSVFLATPYANQFSEPGHPGGSLLALYVVARIPNRGVIVKSAGKVEANPFTGQLYDGLRRPAAVAVYDVHAQLPPGRDLAARDPAGLRELHRDRAADAVVEPLAGVELRKPRVPDHPGLRRRRVPVGRCPAV